MRQMICVFATYGSLLLKPARILGATNANTRIRPGVCVGRRVTSHLQRKTRREDWKKPVSNLPPHHEERRVPLTSGARFKRGFTRVGIAAAVLVTLSGVAMTLFTAWVEYDAKRVTFKSATCVSEIIRAGDPAKIAEARKAGYSDDEIVGHLSQKSTNASGCSRVGLYATPLHDILATADGPAPSFLAEPWLGIGLVASGVSAIAVFLMVWSIGWLCAGFTRD